MDYNQWVVETNGAAWLWAAIHLPGAIEVWGHIALFAGFSPSPPNFASAVKKPAYCWTEGLP